MKITSNATNKVQKRAVAKVEEMVNAVFENPEEADIEIEFSKNGVIYNENGVVSNFSSVSDFFDEMQHLIKEIEGTDDPDSEDNDYESWYEQFIIQANEIGLDVGALNNADVIKTYKSGKRTPKQAAQGYLKDVESKAKRSGKSVSVPKLSKKDEIARAKKERDAGKEEEKLARERAIVAATEEVRRELLDAIAEIAGVVRSEQDHMITGNQARFMKASLLFTMRKTGEKARKAGIKEFSGSALNDFIRNSVNSLIMEQGAAPVSLSNTEISTVVSVYESFGAPFGGVNASYNEVLAWDNNQVKRISKGDAQTRPVGSVDINKLYPLKDMVDSKNKDLLLSFAALFDRSVVYTAAKAMNSVNVREVIDAAIKAKADDIGADDAAEVNAAISALTPKGISPNKTIKVQRAWYEEVFIDVAMAATSLVKHAGLDDLIDPRSGLIKDEELLKVVMNAFLPRKFGIEAIAQAMIENGGDAHKLNQAAAAYKGNV